MEKELYTRLLKAIGKHHINLMEPKELLEISIVTIETIYAHIEENYGYRTRDLSLCAEAVDLIKNYQ